MSNALSVIATYVPPDVTRNALSSPQDLLERTTFQSRHLNAAILFADVSGFTPLTEALAQKGTEGPEELTRLLNTYFTKMISLIEAEGGEVVKFSGDAVTVVFPVEDDDESLGMVTRRAKQAAVAMQTAMTAFANLKTSVGSVELGMKIGVAAGEITASQVGGVRGRWEYVISGDPLRQVAEAEHQAERGDIVLSPEAEAVIFPEVLPPQSLQPFDWHNLNNAELIEQALRRFVPGAVLVLIEEGLHDWLAELRPMSVLFIGIGGLDDQEASAIETLHNFLQSAQHIIYHYEGSINKVAVDDKGTIMIVLFGAPPFAHEDDSERALRCSLDLQTMAQDQGLQLAIGATTGRVFSGPVGSETRREYTVMGDTVNLAARLMGVAGLGGLRCDHETYRGAKNKLVFETYPPVRVKGKAGLIRIYCPIGEISLNDQPENNSQLVGRQTETDVFVKQLQALQTKPGHAHCLLIEGEAGIGKSRLVEEMIVLIREQGLTGLLGTGRSIEQKTPYRAWRDIFSSYFGLDELENPSKKRSAVEEQVRDIVPDQLDRLPLLNDILNVGIAENELTQSLDIHLRHDSLVLLLLALLRAWASERPLVLILEDAHWLDTLSWDLTLQVFRTLSTARLPIFLIVAMRPLEGNRLRIEPTALANLDTTSKLTLGALSPEETLILAA
ncbi:MAG: adenylate/guanylate cyclase domain-containing protein, partial [Chloroflexota bacterium]